jgi:hypothetical protein
MTRPDSASDHVQAPDASDATARAALRQALIDPADAVPDDARLRRLQARALDDWGRVQQERLRGQPAWSPVAAPAVGMRGALPGGGDAGPQLWRMAAGGLLVLALLAAWMWAGRSDPLMDELMRLDVLSQMAAGEM